MGHSSEKICPGCGISLTLRQLMESPDVEPLGMQFIDAELKRNVYYFNHICASCGTTFVVPVTVFLPFIKEPVPDTILTASAQCERHCLDIGDLTLCGSDCRYAPFRRFLITLRERTACGADPSAACPA